MNSKDYRSFISFVNVDKDYHLGTVVIHALKNVSLSIKKGEFVALVGPSGSGKSTFLNLSGCIDQPSKGELYVYGQNTGKLNPKEMTILRRDYIGFIFQEYNLIPVLSARENIEYPLIIRKVAKKERIKRVDKIIELVGLTKWAGHRPDEMSGGQRQRVAIARGLISNPSLVLADEPTANLDTETGAEIINNMQELNKKLGVTFIFSTHDKQIMRHADRIITIKDGSII